MGNKWFVSPEMVRREGRIGEDEFWLDLKRQLSIGERRALETAGFRGMSSGTRTGQTNTEIGVDWRAIIFARALTWIVDWSLTDDSNNKVKLTRDSLEAMREDVFAAIDDLITKHVEENEAAKKA